MQQRTMHNEQLTMNKRKGLGTRDWGLGKEQSKNDSKIARLSLLTAHCSLLICLYLFICLSCSGSSGTGELDKAIREVSNYLNDNIPKGNSVVIVNIQSDYAVLSEYIIDGLAANAEKDKVFFVVEKSAVELLRTGTNYPIAGEVDDNSALELGTSFWAQTVLSGKLSETDGSYRLTIQALEVATGKVQGMYNRTIASIDKKLLSDSKGPIIADLKYTDNNGNYQGTYKGEVFDLQGVPHGKGTRVYASGDAYEGDWVNGMFHGKGKYTFANGNVYIGDFANDMFHGKGKFSLPNGEFVEGTWENDVFIEE